MHSSVVINLGGIFWSSLADRPVSPENDNTYTSDFLYLLVKSAQIYLLFTLLIHWHIYYISFGPKVTMIWSYERSTQFIWQHFTQKTADRQGGLS